MMRSTIRGVCPRVTHSNYHSGETIAESVRNAIASADLKQNLIKYEKRLTHVITEPALKGAMKDYVRAQCVMHSVRSRLIFRPAGPE